VRELDAAEVDPEVPRLDHWTSAPASARAIVEPSTTGPSRQSRM
jgi:hypothetical protein